MKKSAISSKHHRAARTVRFELPLIKSIHNDDDLATNFSERQDIKLIPASNNKNNNNNRSAIRPEYDKNKIHGTAHYVNGTLNLSMNGPDETSNTETLIPHKKNIISLPNKISLVCRNQFTNEESTRAQRKKLSTKDQVSWNQRGILLNVNDNLQTTKNERSKADTNRKSLRHSTTSYFVRARNSLLTCSKRKYKKTCAKKLFNCEVNGSKSSVGQRCPNIIDNAQQKPNYTEIDLSQILSLAYRWHDPPDIHELHTVSKVAPSSVLNCTSNFSDAKIFKKSIAPYKMNRGKMAPITALLRAAREQDEVQLKRLLENAAKNKNSEENINAVDCSGRTAISYICSTNLSHFLEMLLDLPGIDINKADVEMNMPLHYAAECGNSMAIRLLLLQAKIEIDGKNIFGMTPLMKAAIQGHIRCAKILLLAGASPFEVDFKRRLRAEQWARFCGRHSCSELIEKWLHDINKDNNKYPSKSDQQNTFSGRARANSAISTGITECDMANIKAPGGIKSKLSRMLNIVSRDKSNIRNHALNGSRSARSSLETAPSVGLTMFSRSDGFLNTSNIRPLEVPKVEVTTAHNQELIRKYEKRYSLGNESSKPPALPPRKNSKQMFRFKIS